MSKFPESWSTMVLSDAVINITITDKKIPQKEYLSEGAYPVFDQGQDYIGGYTDKNERLVNCELPVIVFGDHTRTVKFVNRPFAPGADGVKVLQPQRFFNPKLLEYFTRHIATHLTNHGYARHYQHLVKSIIPLPPLKEQHRIVAKIEELFSELDKGIEYLKTAQAQLKVCRQALLKHAFEGKLTAQWREQHRDKLETASALQQRIQQERAQRYQRQLADWESSGKLGSKPKPPKTLPLLTAEELAQLPELPEGWGWVKLGQVFNVYVGSTPSRKRADFWNGDISWVSSGEVAFCRIKETKEKITNIGYENASTEIHPIGTIMLAMIGEGKTRGQAAILDIAAAHNQNTAAIRVSESKCSSSFIYYYLVYQYEITRKIGSGNNQKALNKERVSDLIFPLCSIAEMDEVVRCIDEKLSIADQLDQTITTALQQAEALRQSILKKAFSGQLVPQDPNDEPASELLARIKAERVVNKAIIRP